MEYWLRIALLITAISITIRFGLYALRKRSILLSAFGLSLLFLALRHFSLIILDTFTIESTLVQVLNSTAEWSSILSISLVLCGLANLIREAKPEVAQFPLIFTALPLIIVITYPFAYDTAVIKNWLLKMYEGGAIIIGLFMYGYLTYTFKTESYFKIITGVFLFIIAYLSSWFFQDISLIQPWLWFVSMISAIVIFYSGYNDQVQESYS